MKKLLLFIFLISGAYTNASAVEPTPLEKQEQIDNSKKVSALLEQAKTALNSEAQTSESQCMKAIGNSEFCKCIAWQNPGSFVQYVLILSKSKEELNYDRLSKDDKLLVDNTRKARDKCAPLNGN
jgi:SET domain-containing protein